MSINQYSFSEVSLRDGQNGNQLWIIIQDCVYDVTSYMKDHPGGPELITEYAGRNATKAFYGFGHSGEANKLLKTYKIGELIKEDRKSFKPNIAEEQTAQKKKRHFYKCYC